MDLNVQIIMIYELEQVHVPECTTHTGTHSKRILHCGCIAIFNAWF